MSDSHTGFEAKAARRSKGPGVLLALVSASGFSTLGIFAKALYGRGYSVQQTLAWRFSFAAAFLALFLALRALKTSFRQAASGAKGIPGSLGIPGSPGLSGVPSRRVLPLILLGLLGFAPQAGMFFLTVKLLDPGITSLLLYLYPSFVLVFSVFMFRRRPSRAQVLALALSMSGCLLTFFRVGDYPVTGLALGVFVAFAYAAYLVWSERVLAGLDPFSATAVIMGCAAAIYWIWTLASGERIMVPSGLSAWTEVAGVALLATVLPIVTLFAAIKRIGASDTSLASTVEPVFTVALSAAIFGETLTLPQAAGGMLILTAVAILHFSASGTRDLG